MTRLQHAAHEYFAHPSPQTYAEWQAAVSGSKAIKDIDVSAKAKDAGWIWDIFEQTGAEDRND